MKQETFNMLRQQVSDQFCMVKFHDATVWLFNNTIAGCCLTPAHPIGNTVGDFYNTPRNIDDRNALIDGRFPDSCGTCERSEKGGAASMRLTKSLMYADHAPIHIYKTPSHKHDVKTLEVAFENTCNLACSYCSPTFSTAWANDIRVNGPYELKTTGSYMFNPSHTPTDMNLFWTWFDSVLDGLEVLRITGGEPLLHEQTFEILAMAQARKPDLRIAINSNLCQKPILITRMLEATSKLQNVTIYTSNEATGELAEFIRDGMVYGDWITNVQRVTQAGIKAVNMATVGALAIKGLTDLVSWMMDYREAHNIDFTCSFNVLYEPALHSLDVLTVEEKLRYLALYGKFLEDNRDRLTKLECAQFGRILVMLGRTVDNQALLREDHIRFFAQYSERRHKTNLAFN